MSTLLSVAGIQVYYGASHVLHGVDLSVGESEVVALVGRNGAGKTTTLRSIIGLTPPRAGEIRLRGVPIAGRKPHVIARRGVSYVPEGRDVFVNLTVEENLTLARNPEGRWSLEQVLTWFPALRPLLRRKGSQLSGGQQQMMVIGRALLTGPDLLLLDEPSQGLAPVIVNAVLAMLRDLKRERLSVLIVEQSLKVALELADRIYVMNNGRVALETRPSQVGRDLSVLERHMGVGAV